MTNYFVTHRYRNFLFVLNVLIKAPFIMYLFDYNSLLHIVCSPFRFEKHFFMIQMSGLPDTKSVVLSVSVSVSVSSSIQPLFPEDTN
jgi:hypothetical protein